MTPLSGDISSAENEQMLTSCDLENAGIVSFRKKLPKSKRAIILRDVEKFIQPLAMHLPSEKAVQSNSHRREK